MNTKITCVQSQIFGELTDLILRVCSMSGNGSKDAIGYHYFLLGVILFGICILMVMNYTRLRTNQRRNRLNNILVATIKC